MTVFGVGMGTIPSVVEPVTTVFGVGMGTTLSAVETVKTVSGVVMERTCYVGVVARTGCTGVAVTTR